MSPIPWTRLSGDAVEDAVAMLLCAENFEATQVRPGRGDGGIDVFVPTSDDLSVLEIYQVKRYSESLTSSQKRKIKRSLDQVVKTANDQGWTISVWRLVLPLNPTPNDLNWLSGLAEEHPFPCRWVGLNRIETLVAKHPQVTDYYLRDGRERLQQQMDRLTAIVARRETRPTGEELRPLDVMNDLRGIYSALNECDPHYRYEISMTANAPSAQAPPNSPGLVAIVGSGSREGWINVSIFARSLAAMEKRPITGSMKINLPEGDPARKSYEKFVNFGTPVSIPRGLASVDLDLPGGLGGELGESLITIGPAEVEDPNTSERELVLAMLSHEKTPVAEIVLEQIEVTVGQTGGRRTVWQDSPGFITLEVLAREYPDLTANFSISVDASGKRPASIAASLEFLANMHEPNIIALSQAFGPRNFSTSGSAILAERDRDYVRMAKLARALESIQDHVSTRILFPKSFTGDQAIAILNAARTLTGNPITADWNELRVVRDTASDAIDVLFEPGDEADLRLVRDIEIEIDDRKLVVGKEMALMRGVVKGFTSELAVFGPSRENPKATLVRFDGDVDDGRVHARAIEDESARTTE